MGEIFMPVKIIAIIKTVAVVGLLLWAGRTVPYWGSWASSLFKKNPAQMCSASEIVDRLTTEIRDVTTNLEEIYGGKSAPSESNVTVIVGGVSAVDYNADIDRVKCFMTYQVNGAERANTMAALQGHGAQRSLAYFVQPDANGRLIVSW
jgi:hypothetical protein